MEQPAEAAAPSPIETPMGRDEPTDPLTTLQGQLSDADPEVRSEAAALLEVWYAEQRSIPAHSGDQAFNDD